MKAKISNQNTTSATSNFWIFSNVLFFGYPHNIIFSDFHFELQKISKVRKISYATAIVIKISGVIEIIRTPFLGRVLSSSALTPLSLCSVF